MRHIEIELDGTKFLWNGSAWTDHRFLAPPANIRGRLMSQLIHELEATSDAGLPARLATDAARCCFEAGNLQDAEALARRVLRAKPGALDAAMVLAEVARRRRKPREALEITEHFGRRRNAELHTLRAAAFADAGDWDAAEKALRRSIAIEKANASTETVRVMARVMAARAKSTAA